MKNIKGNTHDTMAHDKIPTLQLTLGSRKFSIAKYVSQSNVYQKCNLANISELTLGTQTVKNKYNRSASKLNYIDIKPPIC